MKSWPVVRDTERGAENLKITKMEIDVEKRGRIKNFNFMIELNGIELFPSIFFKSRLILSNQYVYKFIVQN